MRNFNTSFVKNAIRFFANEASNVLRAVTQPAIAILRLIQSSVRAFLVFVLPTSYRLTQLQDMPAANLNQGTSEIIGRLKSAMLGDAHGGDDAGSWDCPYGLTVS